MRPNTLCTTLGGLVVAFVLSLLALPALAYVDGTGFKPVEEVPIERLLQNIERNRSKMRMGDYWLALGRLYLLAYIRQTKTLPAITYGREGDEVVDDGPFIGCKPIAPLPKSSVDESARTPRSPFGTKATCTTNDRQYDFPARRGLPEGTLAVRHSADDHLRKAVDAYERVKALYPDRIRPRLALAYAYDRSSQIDKALVELRHIVDSATAALPKFESREAKYEERYWDYQVVAAEAIEHLTQISKSKEDVARIKKLRPKLKTPEKMELYITPIFVPLTEAEGMQPFVSPSANVRFDLTGQGLPLEGGWITKDAAWLVWDPHDKRKITNGFQLFGSVTWLTTWDNGYVALAALDDNGDGKIAGAELNGLALWHDKNANGVSDKGEVRPVAAWSIVSLGYRYKRHSDDAWISKNGVTFANGKMRPTYDWVICTRLISVASAKEFAEPPR